MAERAFNAYPHEVRAIQAGLQTQFRRVVKPQPPEWAKYPQDAMNGWEWTGRDVDTDDLSHWPDYYRPMLCPYGQPGDRLWVRETWREWGELSLHYAADGLVVPMLSDRKLAHYLAHRSPFTWHSYKWRPSIHMPRWASRITLEVTGVRVERLWDISEADAIAEGIGTIQVSESDERWVNYCDPDYSKAAAFGDPRKSFWSLFESLHGTAALKANPWVWVVSFKRVEVSNGIQSDR